MTENAVTNLIKRIQSIKDEKGTCLVAIEGRCAAGKSTLAAVLGGKLDCPVFHMDDYYLRPEQRSPERYAEAGGNVDWERFAEEVIRPLQQKQDVITRPFDCASMTMSQEGKKVPWNAVAIVEGSYSCHPKLIKAYDLKVFLTVSPDEQLYRISKRNGANLQMFKEKWIPLEEAYFKAYNIEAVCDRTLDTSTQSWRKGGIRQWRFPV